MSTSTTSYGPCTITHACGHTSQVTQINPVDTTDGCLCAACMAKEWAKQDREANRITRRLTGEVSDYRGHLRWRLRATEAEVQAALEAAGLPVPTMERDAGDDSRSERKAHAVTLRIMKCGRVRCACGDHGTWSHTVSGTCGDKPALWAECGNCRGTAIGSCLTGDTMYAAIAAIEAAERCGEDIDEWVDAA
jgi:hypothetical protein